jgi:putative ABC transport system permease protein
VVVEQDAEAAARVAPGEAYNAFPGDAQQRIEALNGVAHAGVWWPMDLPGSEAAVSALPPGVGQAGSGVDGIGVYAATPGAVEAARPEYSLGRGFDAFCQDRAEHVVVLGSAAARRLGIGQLETNPAVFIGGQAFTVVGVIGDVERNAEFLAAAIIPSTVAPLWGQPKEISPRMLIETDLGAAQLVGAQAAMALRPDRPELLRAIVPPDPKTLRDNVSNDLSSLFLALAAVSLIIGAFGIANTTLVSVLERIPEIGLRRSLGARPSHITAQFLAESAVLGTLGGITGTTLGILTVLGAALAQNWTAIMPTALLAASLIGTLTGLAAGLYPALKATRIEPANALRQ